MMDERQRIGVLREIALRADGFYDKAEELGKVAAGALKRERRAQITGLEGIANSALKTTDVFDFIKLRTARHEEWRKGGWGPDLLNMLSQNLRNDKNTICQEVRIEPQSLDGLEVHLFLIREFVHQLAAQYEYECWKAELEKANG